MLDRVPGKSLAALAYLGIAGLVFGGLAWVTAEALRLETEQAAARADADRAGRMRLALQRLDAAVAPAIFRENLRPFNHYSTAFAPSLVMTPGFNHRTPGSVLEPSPLLYTELPPWMRLHFQGDAGAWDSPQVLSSSLREYLRNVDPSTLGPNITPQRERELTELNRRHPVEGVLARARERTAAGPAPVEAAADAPAPANPPAQPPNPAQAVQAAFPPEWPFARGAQDRQAPAPNDADPAAGAGFAPRNLKDGWYEQRVYLGSLKNYRKPELWWRAEENKEPDFTEVVLRISPLTPVWAAAADGGEQLLLLRIVRAIDGKDLVQGIVLDGAALRRDLAQLVNDLFDGATLEPVHEATPDRPEATMVALPLRLEPGPAPAAEPGWTPLRVGLSLAWAAALVALAAVGLGGAALINLTERRTRFVSAVTHELRTPLTTLQLYLDMLTNGMVREEKQRDEYLHTMDTEANRLCRLVSNVLAFSRLERQRPKLHLTRVPLAELVEALGKTWGRRCGDAGKELVVEASLPEGAAVWTDAELVQQVVGNLIDNAIKYSKDAADRRVWLRVAAEAGRLAVEVEDRGPGVAARERRGIFRAFRRGRQADMRATGGVGLGLALSQSWVRLLGGRLTLQPAPAAGGACFRVELPWRTE